MWGQGTKSTCNQNNLRIIPTRVGTRNGEHAEIYRQWDHPHACGDKFKYVRAIIYDTGSSPRVWGQAGEEKKMDITQRIIPTRVGTRRTGRSTERRTQDHPHACGDKCRSFAYLFLCQGSSPRVWGQGKSGRTFLSLFRIIPTRVGTS